MSDESEPYWIHTAAGLHMGRMEPRPLAGEFGAVLTLAEHPGTVDPAVPHRHIPLSYIRLDPDALADAIEWVHQQFLADRKILVRSERGTQRPALVIASVFVRLGATDDEALYSVRRNNWRALSDFRYVNVVRALHQAINTPPAP